MRRLPIYFFFLMMGFLGMIESNVAADYGNQQIIDKKTHYAYPWKVHEIAKDFELLDVWEYPILADKTRDQDFFFFLKVMRQSPPKDDTDFFSPRLILAKLLVTLRVYLGELFGLDKNINSLPVPGCQETSIQERLSAQDREKTLDLSFVLGIQNQGIWNTVYLYENEMLTELSIATAHALMHIGWIHKSGNYYAARLAVYAKPRGDLGKLYMALIMPFRRWIIYPVMLEDVKNKWITINK